MPAIWPPVRPRRASAVRLPVPVPVADEVPLVVEVAVTGWSEEDAMIGNTTPAQRPGAFENTQHESVAFGELAEQ